MKVRTGYVSNSSSSSFVVKYNKSSALKCLVKEKTKSLLKFSDFLEFVDRVGNANWSTESTSIIAHGIESVRDYYKENDWNEEFNAEMLRRIDECKDFKEVAIIRVEYSDKLVRDLLKLFENAGQIKILDDSES